MRREFIEVETLAEAEATAPWACVIIRCEGGYRAFESARDADMWEQQK